MFEDGIVITPEGYGNVWTQMAEGGWIVFLVLFEFGGVGMFCVVSMVCNDLFIVGCCVFMMYFGLIVVVVCVIVFFVQLCY